MRIKLLFIVGGKINCVEAAPPSESVSLAHKNSAEAATAKILGNDDGFDKSCVGNGYDSRQSAVTWQRKEGVNIVTA